MSKRATLGLSLLFVIPACGESSSPSNDEVGAGAETENTDVGDTSTEGSTEAGEEGGFQVGPARGINIITVELNQGVGVPIGQGADWVDGPERNARIVKTRPTIIRVHHEVDAAWVPREIEARLTLNLPGGESRVLTQVRGIGGNSTETQLESGFAWQLDFENGETDPGITYQVELFEVAAGGEALPEGIHTNPAEGPMLVGFEDIEMEMNIRFIPFQYNHLGTTPDIYYDVYQNVLLNGIFEQKPVIRLNPEWLQPVEYNGVLTSDDSVCDMLPTMNQLWQQDGAPANIYYVGLIDMPFLGGTAGCAWLGSNINANVWHENKSALADTIVHEMGHDSGLSHADCENGNYPDGQQPSPEYPDHPLGRILNTGYGVRSGNLYAWQNTYDYMTYCTPSWVSPWTWGRTWSEVQEFSAMGDYSPTTPVLHQYISPSGKTETWTSVADVDTERLSGLHEVEFVKDGQVVFRSPSVVDVLSDDRSIWITTPLPEGGVDAEFDSIRNVTAEGIEEKTRDQIKFIRPRAK